MAHVFGFIAGLLTGLLVRTVSSGGGAAPAGTRRPGQTARWWAHRRARI